MPSRRGTITIREQAHGWVEEGGGRSRGSKNSEEEDDEGGAEEGLGKGGTGGAAGAVLTGVRLEIRCTFALLLELLPAAVVGGPAPAEARRPGLTGLPPSLPGADSESLSFSFSLSSARGEEGGGEVSKLLLLCLEAHSFNSASREFKVRSAQRSSASDTYMVSPWVTTTSTWPPYFKRCKRARSL